jgi:hypothetical protein
MHHVVYLGLICPVLMDCSSPAACHQQILLAMKIMPLFLLFAGFEEIV